MKTFLILSIIFTTLLGALPFINEYESTHNYPFGRMCELTAQCR